MLKIPLRVETNWQNRHFQVCGSCNHISLSRACRACRTRVDGMEPIPLIFLEVFDVVY